MVDQIIKQDQISASQNRMLNSKIVGDLAARSTTILGVGNIPNSKIVDLAARCTTILEVGNVPNSKIVGDLASKIYKNFGSW